MATAIACDLCETEQAVMMQTSLVNGETISVGEACLMVFMGGAFAGMLDQAGNDVIAMHEPSLSELVERMAKRLNPVVAAMLRPQDDSMHTEHDTGPREDGGISVPDTDGRHDYGDLTEDQAP